MATINNTKTKALAMLKDYVNQMRAAGYSDALIKKKILENPTITIPEDVSGYGGETWTPGMSSELLPVTKTPLSRSKEAAMGGIPGISDYQSYKPGGQTTQLPNYAELMGQVQPTGQFGQTKQTNLMQALADYLANYQGKTLGYDQGLMEVGVAGMPREYGAQLFQQYKQQQGQQAGMGDQKQKNMDLSLEYPEAEININDTYENNIAKIMQSKKKESADKAMQEVVDLKLKALSDEDKTAFYSEVAQGQTPKEEMLANARNAGVFLTVEEINYIYKKYAPKIMGIARGALK